MKKKRGLGLKGILLILVILAALFLSLIGFITDYLWFKEMGYVSVFFTQLFTQLKLGIPTFVVITLLSVLYLKGLKRGYFKKVESSQITDEKRLNLFTWALAVAFAALITFAMITQLWFEVLKFTNSTPFDIADPLFNLDISFYLFKLEFIKQINNLLLGVIVGFSALTVLYHMLLVSMRKPQVFEEEMPDDEPEEGEGYSGNFNAGPGLGGLGGFGNLGDLVGKFAQTLGGRPPGGARPAQRPRKRLDENTFMQLVNIASKQLIVLGAIFFLMVGVNFFLKQYDLLYSHTGVLYGAGFTDVNVTLWVYRALVVLSVVGAIAFIIGISRKKFRMILTVPVIMIVVGLIGTGAGMLVQNFVVSPDEINKESKYLERNIQYTQYAYDLNNVIEKNFAADNNLTIEDIANNMETISNIRINDYEPAKKFYNNVQTIRQYYAFQDVDVDRYMINGEYTQTFLSPREVDQTKISDQWLNRHIKYTHGYGITLSRVDKVTASGQPDMLISDIPPKSSIPEITIERPEIYFGELTNGYILVNTKEQEFDYPNSSNEEEEENVYSMYQGTAGIKLNFFNKAMFAIRERSLKIFVSTNITSDSKIVINRNIQERVQKIMPRLAYDEDPYIVTVDGKLYWIIDAYTVSTNYPYSEPYNSAGAVNYIRNSVKVVIDAYNGDTRYYLVDEKDPIANTYKSIYPALFKNFEEMPESLKAHIRYPNMMLKIQANVYKRYHMTDVKVFYQGEDLWDISKEIREAKDEVTMEPNYYIMKLPGEEKAEFVNSIPYTPRDKKNLTGLLVARNDGENYGDLVLYKLPKGKMVYGPMQIEAQIDQSTEISKEFSLWNSSGSTYNRGNMFVIPIENSLLYVEPVYLEATNSSIPEVKRVIVAYGDRIAYEPTLSAALESLFGTQSGNEPSGDGSDEQTPTEQGDGTAFTMAQLIELAARAFDNAQAAQQSGNWSAYGKHLADLESYLGQLKALE